MSQYVDAYLKPAIEDLILIESMKQRIKETELRLDELRKELDLATISSDELFRIASNNTPSHELPCIVNTKDQELYYVDKIDSKLKIIRVKTVKYTT